MVQRGWFSAADEIVLALDLMSLDYNGVTFVLIKMGKVTQRAFIVGPVAPWL